MKRLMCILSAAILILTLGVGTAFADYFYRGTVTAVGGKRMDGRYTVAITPTGGSANYFKVASDDTDKNAVLATALTAFTTGDTVEIYFDGATKNITQILLTK